MSLSKEDVLFEKIISRRSIRKFTDREVKDEEIRKIIKAAINAPCGGINQIWRFKIIKDIEIINSIKKSVYCKNYLGNSKCVIAVFIEHISREFNQDRYDPLDNPDYGTGFAAVENILLAAHFLGLGACWYKSLPESREEIKRIYNLSDNYTLISLVSIGYYKESDQLHGKPERKSIEEYII